MRLVLLAFALLALASCGEQTQVIPEGFEVPRGVELTLPDAELALGETASWIANPVGGQPTVLVGSASDVRAGTIKDFFGFQLSEKSQQSTPVYVTFDVRNGGPGTLTNYELPILAGTNGTELIPVTPINGPFNVCQIRELPEDFGSGISAQLCLVYLIPSGETMDSLVLQMNAEQEVRWLVNPQ